MSVEPMRKRSVPNSGSNYGPRIAALEAKADAMQSTLDTVESRVTQATTDLAAVKSDTETIRDILVHTKSVGGFVAKHGPRVIAFVLGGAVLSGRMSEGTAALFRTFFGIVG